MAGICGNNPCRFPGAQAVERTKKWVKASIPAAGKRFKKWVKASILKAGERIKNWVKSSTSLHLICLFLFLLITAFFFKWRLQFTKEHGDPRPFNGTLSDTIGEGFYWATTTVTTVGYGDVIPNTLEGKIGTCLVLFFGLIVTTMATHTLNEAWSEVEETLLDAIIKCLRGDLFVDDRGRKILTRRVFAVLYSGVCLGVGTVLFHCTENLNLMDAFYASVASATTLGYGDIAFSTKLGRVLASFWLVFATASLARVYELQTEARLHRRSMKLLEKEFTREELLNEHLLPTEDRMNDFKVFKLKRAKKFDDKDLIIINQQFQKFRQACIDHRNTRL